MGMTLTRRAVAGLFCTFVCAFALAQAPGGDADIGNATPLTGNPEPDSRWPLITGAQYTFIRQDQSSLHSPYRGPLSLDPSGDVQSTNTIGVYGGWAPLNWLQLYLDTEKF